MMRRLATLTAVLLTLSVALVAPATAAQASRCTYHYYYAPTVNHDATYSWTAHWWTPPGSSCSISVQNVLTPDCPGAYSSVSVQVVFFPSGGGVVNGAQYDVQCNSAGWVTIATGVVAQTEYVIKFGESPSANAIVRD